jgi:argininosuccinate lyase
MNNTGRIKEPLKESIQSIIYGKNSNDAIETELKYVVQVDRAHILMLYRQNILSLHNTKSILNQIKLLEDSNFKAIRDQRTPRGIYFLYEDYLRKTIGEQYGGMLQFGRSRNDLKATVFKIRLREPLLMCIDEIINLVSILLQKSKEHSDVIMPIYTHYQPAVPITYGHYLSAISEELMNIVEDIFSNTEIQKSPLGSGAVGGTTVQIDTNYTAKLLGFSSTVNNSIIGVASRKLVQDLLSILVKVESLVSRCCEDYLLWTSSDLQFIYLPDYLVGGSSMMPNKRNAFLFENIRGRCSKALGAFVSAITAMKGEPFTNSISVGTESASYVWDVITNTYEILYIFEEIITDAQPNREKMLQRSKDGYTLATEYANYLTLHFGEDFRNAHKIIGTLVKESIDTGAKIETLVSEWIENKTGNRCSIELDIESCVSKTNYGWGPGENSQKEIRKNNQQKLSNIRKCRINMINMWQEANEYMYHEINRIEEDNI